MFKIGVLNFFSFYIKLFIRVGLELTTSEVESLNDPENETNLNDSDDSTNRKGLTASDLYDLTLTAIAFLGFGTFVMNLIMDAMAVSAVYSATVTF